MSKQDIDLFKHENKIRKAFHAGHETIVLEDRQFKMRRIDKDRVFQVTHDKEKVDQRQTESWILVSPVRGRFPMASIELEYQGNMRTVKVK